MKKTYTQTVDVVLEQTGSSLNGLSHSQAAHGLEVHGPNKLKEGKKRSLPLRVLDQIKDPMIIVLISAAIISGSFGEIADMAIILLVVFLNAALGIVQEAKAEKEIEALQKMSSPHAKVKRDGAVETIDTSQLTIGDIVLLEAGDSIPADLRLVEVATMKTEEAALTGESLPTTKTVLPLEDDGGKELPPGDRTNMAYMGTSVTHGRGVGVVTAIGMDTEMGKIASILANTGDDLTPLQKKLAGLSKVLSLAVIGICAFIFFFTVFRSGGFHGGQVFEAFLTAVTLAVAAIPEGLVVVVTVLLSIGVRRMSSKNAIIRRLTAVETLGCTDVICSDKTGTLTQNKMTVVKHIGEENSLAKALALCNNSAFDSDGNPMGDPTETALIDYSRTIAIDPLNITAPRVGEAPFDSDRKMMSTLHSQISSGAKITQYTKGAPDIVLDRCSKILVNGQVMDLDLAKREEILKANKEMADQALRVLGGAYKEYPSLPENMEDKALEKDMIFLGLVGMIDPIRPEVKVAIDKCKDAGLKAIMITGDHKDTAMAIGRELGILTPGMEAITGAQLALMSDEEFESKVSNIAIYARVQPEHKVRIVNMWRKKGKITAMTGDGVNDAPALKNADIGVGMGITGTDVTKNVADMVLADDNFATIVCAVEEGRRIYENIRKSVQFLLASNLSEVVAIFIATLFGWRLFAPIHILWINLITDTFPAMALGMEESEDDSMKKPPRPAGESIFAGGLGVQVLYQGVVVAFLTLAAFIIGNGQSHITGMTMAFLTLSMCEIFHAFNMRSRTKSIFTLKGQNKYLWGAVVLAFILTMSVIYIPGLNIIFKLTPLSLGNFGYSLAIAFAVIPIVELVKLIQRKSNKS